ncbi:MAG: dockerin type I repeat-containing protein [Lacipirellulaceae bacterium]
MQLTNIGGIEEIASDDGQVGAGFTALGTVGPGGAGVNLIASHGIGSLMGTDYDTLSITHLGTTAAAAWVFALPPTAAPSTATATAMSMPELSDLSLNGVVNASDIDALGMYLSSLNSSNRSVFSSRQEVFVPYTGQPNYEPYVAQYTEGAHPRFDINLDTRVSSTVSISSPSAVVSDLDYLVRTRLLSQYGDANLDGRVDLTDRSIVLQSMNTPARGWSRGDFNGDGVVNGTDYYIWSTFAGWTRPPATSIPEPAAVALLMAVMLGAGTRRSLAGR